MPVLNSLKILSELSPGANLDSKAILFLEDSLAISEFLIALTQDQNEENKEKIIFHVLSLTNLSELSLRELMESCESL